MLVKTIKVMFELLTLSLVSAFLNIHNDNTLAVFNKNRKLTGL